MWTSAGNAPLRRQMFRARAVRWELVIDPDILADFLRPAFPDNTFALVVFDPPHFESATAKDGLA